MIAALDDGTIALLDGVSGVPTGTIAATPDRRLGNILGEAVSASTLVVSTAFPARLTAWSLTTGQREWSLSPDFPVFGWYELSAHAEVIVACMPTSAVASYDVANGRTRWVRALPSGPCATATVADPDMLLVTARDGASALRWK